MDKAIRPVYLPIMKIDRSKPRHTLEEIMNAGDGREMLNEVLDLATHLGISVTLGNTKVNDV